MRALGCCFTIQVWLNPRKKMSCVYIDLPTSRVHRFLTQGDKNYEQETRNNQGSRERLPSPRREALLASHQCTWILPYLPYWCIWTVGEGVWVCEATGSYPHWNQSQLGFLLHSSLHSCTVVTPPSCAPWPAQG